jgi:magnesium-transporting ATPase (P-type)
LLARITVAGGFSALAALVLMLTHDGSEEHVRWLAYTSLVVGQVVRSYSNRSLDRPVTSLRPNGFLALAGVVVLAIQIAIPFVPPLAEAFRATPLDPVDWTFVAVIALAPAVVAEIVRRATGREWVA